MGRPGTVAFCLGRILTVHEGCFIWADRVLFTQTVVEPWAVSLFLVLSGPYTSLCESFVVFASKELKLVMKVLSFF
jgi:hypothetical protein